MCSTGRVGHGDGGRVRFGKHGLISTNMADLVKPKAGEDVRVLHKNVEQLIDGVNTLLNMTARYEGKVRGIGFLTVRPGASEIVIKASDPGPTQGAPQKQASTCTVSITPDPADVGTVVTVFALVPGSTGGTILFRIDGVATGNYPVDPNTHGAGFNDSNMQPGTHLIQAHFSGDTNLLPCDGSGSAIINSLGAPNETLTSSINPSDVDQAVSFTADFTGNPTPIPTGTVTFFINDGQWGTVPIAGGVATTNTHSFSAAGHYTIEADYNGDGHWGETYRTLDQVVTDTVLVELAIIPDPVNTNTAIDFYVQVSGHGPIPSGQVVLLKNGSVWSGLATLDGSGHAHFSLPGGVGTAGDYSIQAEYSGDANYSPATSDPVDLTVTTGINALTLVQWVAAPLPDVITSIWGGGGGNLYNQYQIQTSPNTYTGSIHFAIINGPWGTVWNNLGQVIFNGPLIFGVGDGNNHPAGWPLNGPSGDVQITNGIGYLWINIWCGGLEVSGSAGMTCVGHIWIQASVGSTPILINNASTYVLEFVPGP